MEREMTLLSICTDTADEVGISRPATVIGSSSPDAQKLLRYANRVGNRLMKAVSWQALRKEQTFTSISGETQTGILPADFDRFIPETFWNRSTTVLVTGPIGPVEWQGIKATGFSDSCKPKFAYRSGSVLILPSLSAGQSLAFEYVSKNWAQSSGSVAQEKFQADTDTSLIDEELITYGTIYEYLDGEGLPSGKALVAYEDRFNVLLQNDQPNAEIMLSADIFGGGRHFSGAPPVNNPLRIV